MIRNIQVILKTNEEQQWEETVRPSSRCRLLENFCATRISKNSQISQGDFSSPALLERFSHWHNLKVERLSCCPKNLRTVIDMLEYSYCPSLLFISVWSWWAPLSKMFLLLLLSVQTRKTFLMIVCKNIECSQSFMGLKFMKVVGIDGSRHTKPQCQLTAPPRSYSWWRCRDAVHLLRGFIYCRDEWMIIYEWTDLNSMWVTSLFKLFAVWCQQRLLSSSFSSPRMRNNVEYFLEWDCNKILILNST